MFGRTNTRDQPHRIQADTSGKFVLHVDLGLDKIFVWKFDADKGTLTPNNPLSLLRDL